MVGKLDELADQIMVNANDHWLEIKKASNSLMIVLDIEDLNDPMWNTTWDYIRDNLRNWWC